jgi:uncharacterized double-CXXCG motif protein
MRYYWLKPVEAPRHTGEYSAVHRWKLPGVHCPMCHASWSEGSDAYPCVDLSGVAEHQKLQKARLEEDFTEYERLRELVRPFIPAGLPLWPGSAFGPLVGTARGTFGQLVMQDGWELLIHREALEQLQREGVQGLKGCRAELRFRQKNSPELLELQIEPRGLLHPDCLPERPPPCPKCGQDAYSRPEQPLLETASLPERFDLFRLANFPNMIVGTERFVDAVQRLGFEEVAFRELPVR